MPTLSASHFRLMDNRVFWVRVDLSISLPGRIFISYVLDRTVHVSVAVGSSVLGVIDQAQLLVCPATLRASLEC
jgi:hypothetical protein